MWVNFIDPDLEFEVDDPPEIGTYITIDSTSGFNYGDLFLFDHPERVLIDWISHDGLMFGIPVDEWKPTRGYDPTWVYEVIEYLDQRLGVAR